MRACLVDLFEALSHPREEVQLLLNLKDKLSQLAVADIGMSEPRYRPKRRPPLADRLGTDGVAALSRDFLAGMTKDELARLHGCSTSTIERVLRAVGARRWRRT